MSKSVTYDRINKIYDAKGKNPVHALKDVSFTINPGELFCLLGPSGCGKTTLLRATAGLEDITSGKMYYGDVDISTIPPYRRNIGMVFQSFALYPHMTIFENVAYGLRVRKVDNETVKKKVTEVMELVGLQEELKRNPSPTGLSGGQQQRVAIARALVYDPDVLLLDEPLANLDAKLRLEMRSELKRLHVDTDSTFVYVTHDQMEAMALATKICLMNKGLLQQYAPPLEVYNKPSNLFAADFVGNPSINFIEASGRQEADGSIALSILDGIPVHFRPAESVNLQEWQKRREEEAHQKEERLKARSKEKDYVEKSNKEEIFRYHIQRTEELDESLESGRTANDDDFVIGIRPELLVIDENGPIEGEIYGAMPTGMESTIKVCVKDYLLTSVIFGNLHFRIGTKVRMKIAESRIMLFDRKSGKFITLGSIEF